MPCPPLLLTAAKRERGLRPDATVNSVTFSMMAAAVASARTLPPRLAP